MVRVQSVTALENHRVRLTFTGGTERVIDLEPYLRGPIFEEIRSDRELFREVRVDKDLGSIVWPNGADIDPDVLYGNRTPAWLEAESA